MPKPYPWRGSRFGRSSKLAAWATLILLLLVGCRTAPGALAGLPSTPPPTFAVVFDLIAALESTPAPEASTTLPPKLSDRPYRQPQGLYRLSLPEGWQVQEHEEAVELRAPHGNGRARIQVTHTGQALDAAGFERFVAGREVARFGDQPGYGLEQRRADGGAGRAVVEKTLESGGKRQVVHTRYRQFGAVIWILDLWAEPEQMAGYAAGFEQAEQDLVVDTQAAAKLELYAPHQVQTCPQNLCRLSVPESWQLERLQGQYSQVDTYTAPDGKAVVQTGWYADEQTLNNSLAGEFVLFLMHNFLGSDLRVARDVRLPDRRERLDWYSAGKGYAGVTIFETRGGALLLVGGLYEGAAGEEYRLCLERILESFRRN